MSKNIFDKTIDYFEHSKNIAGDYIYFEIKPEMPLAQPQAIIQPQKAQPIPAFPQKAEPTPVKVSAKKEELAKPMPIISANEESVDPSWTNAVSLDELKGKIEKCLRCPLGSTRTKFVFGEGNPNADIMVIGEAPGADEDMQGMPFVGRAGQLLTKILESVGFSREEVFIGNINKCRPPANRRPTSEEVAACEPYLIKQIDIIKPKFILALGLTAADTLFKKAHKMGDVRGQLFNYNGIQTMITYHPAALLRNPAWKKPVWEDVQLLRKLYDDYLNNNK